ncbi:MAG: CHAT domain-containing protein, partial [Myxococcota bacterium]
MLRRSSSALLLAIALAGAADASPDAAGERGSAAPGVAGAATEAPAFAQANEARVAIERGGLDGVEAELDAAVAASGSQGRDAARVRLHAGRSFVRLAEATGGSRAALASLRAAALFDEAHALASAAGDARLASFALGYRGAIYEDAGRLDEAATLTRRALLAADRAHASDALYRWHWQLGRIQRAQAHAAAALASYRRAVARLDVLRAELASTSTDAAFAFRAEVEPVYVELVDLLLREAAAADDDPVLLAEARDTLEALKAAELRDHFSDPCLDAQRETTPEAVPGAVVLYPVVLPDRVELILSTDAGLSRHVSGVDGETLRAETKRLRRLITKRTTRQFLPSAQKLYDWLIRPLDDALAGRRISAFVAVPSGALRTIPFAALHDAQSGEFLIEKVPVAVTPGLTLTDPRAIDREAAIGLVAGVSEGVQGFPPLASVPAEVEQVARAFPGVALLDREFVVARFESEVRARPVSIVHVASHGEFNGDAERSFVLAYDEKIPMAELAS